MSRNYVEEYKARKEYHSKWWNDLKKDPERLAEHYRKSREWKEKNKEATKQIFIRSKIKNPEAWLLKNCKARAKQKGMEFNLELSDIVIPEVCPIMKQPLKYIPEGYSDYSPSVDRIDSNLGYIKGNVWVISSIANRMKWNATKEQLISFASGVLSLEIGGCSC